MLTKLPQSSPRETSTPMRLASKEDTRPGEAMTLTTPLVGVETTVSQIPTFRCSIIANVFAEFAGGKVDPVEAGKKGGKSSA
jgi:hypothetical protein